MIKKHTIYNVTKKHMINASELNKQTQEVVNSKKNKQDEKILSSIENLLKTYAAKGYFSLLIDSRTKFSQNVIDVLRSQGFKVDRQRETLSSVIFPVYTYKVSWE